MSRRIFLALVVLLVFAGLLLRLIHWGLPSSVHHYGGGFLWGAMIFALVAALRPPTWGRSASIAAASLVVIIVELVRLCHTPALDAFRTTLAGQLLLGRIYASWNIVIYELGIAAAVLATWWLPFEQKQKPPETISGG